MVCGASRPQLCQQRRDRSRPGFGNLTDEVWVITWYASTVADCDYTSCGPSYPEGTVDIEAARITSPATLSLNNTVLSDRDGDGMEDTVEINYGVFKRFLRRSGR